MNKKEIRNIYLKRRDSLSNEYRFEASLKIFDYLQNDIFLSDNDILCFVNYKTEVLTTELIKILLNNSNNRIFVPKVNENNMEFYHIDSLNQLSKGYMGIMEPDNNLYNLNSDYSEQSVILIPGSVYDTKGHRIGYGGGFYDRFLAIHPQMARVGIAFDNQISEDILPVEEHDISVSYVVTEKGIIAI